MTHDRIDWSQLWYPGPRRVFSKAELERAGGRGPSRTLVMVAMVNLCALGLVVLQMAPAQSTPRLTALLIAAVALAGVAAKRLWQQPSRRMLLHWSIGYCIVALLFGVAMQWRVSDNQERLWVFGVCWIAPLLTMFGLWFLSIYRADQIAGRLRELDERAQAEELARQLAQAQIQPHFLFNSLASLQHWVQLKDDRAAPLLQALSGFLRATLPLFDRRWLRLDEEIAAVQQYLAVMQLRLGDRLRWHVDVQASAAAVTLPPGLLLTLVENAIEHGVLASLNGAEVVLQARLAGHRLRIEVCDSGPGPAAQAGPGVGLANARARLAQAYGTQAVLTLEPGPEGGAIARIECPAHRAPTTATSQALPAATPED